MGRRVVVTGCGVVSSLGCGLSATSVALRDGVSGIRRFDSGVAAPVTLALDTASRRTDRVSQLALMAGAEAMSQSGLEREPLLCARAGVYIGTALGGATSLEEAYATMLLDDAEPAPFSILRSMTASPAAHLSIRYRLAGPNITVASACASSTIAIGEAFHAIRSGRLDTALAGGAEACLTPGVTRAWNAMRVLAPIREDQPSASCRPFSRDRQGLVLGEGAAMFVLESLSSASERSASPLCEMLGYACAADASHIARPNAAGQAEAMVRALTDAGVESDAIDYINAHGTGTRVGDACETLAIKKAFGSRAAGIAISATKSGHGHLLGAAGALELAVTVVAMLGAFIPATLHLSVADPDCDLDYVPITPRRNVSIRRAMMNSFAFGGSNAVLVVGSVPECPETVSSFRLSIAA